MAKLLAKSLRKNIAFNHKLINLCERLNLEQLKANVLASFWLFIVFHFIYRLTSFLWLDTVKVFKRFIMRRIMRNIEYYNFAQINEWKPINVSAKCNARLHMHMKSIQFWFIS